MRHSCTLNNSNGLNPWANTPLDRHVRKMAALDAALFDDYALGARLLIGGGAG
jgi:hypothetical protein